MSKVQEYSLEWETEVDKNVILFFLTVETVHTLVPVVEEYLVMPSALKSVVSNECV